MKKIITFLLLAIVVKIGFSQTYPYLIMDSPPPSQDYYFNYKSEEYVETTAKKVLDEVPAYIWSYGCTPTAAAMLIGYYDRTGYPCLYRGGKLNGQAPKNNSLWQSNTLPNGGLNYLNSISASKKGYDDRPYDGHIDDFWAGLGQTGDPDGHSFDGVPPHWFAQDQTIGNDHCVADWLGTSQDYWNTADSETKVIDFAGISNYKGEKIFDYIDCESQPSSGRWREAMHGLRLFIEDAGYEIDYYNNGEHNETWCYTQATNNKHSKGFSFDDLINEIDSDRPVLLFYQNHATIAIGYRIRNNGRKDVCMYDTWSTTKRWEKWGTKLSSTNFALLSVGVIKLKKSIMGEEFCGSIIVGENDYVTIIDPEENTTGPPDGSIMPMNTYSFEPGEIISFFGEFTSYDGTTDILSNGWHYKIKLFHSTGSMEYMTYVGGIGNTWRWTTNASNLPSGYDWYYESSEELGEYLYGEVEVTVDIDDGTYTTDTKPISLVTCPRLNIYDFTNTVDNSETGCNVHIRDVVIQNNSNLTVEISKEATIEYNFEVKLGSSFGIAMQ